MKKIALIAAAVSLAAPAAFAKGHDNGNNDAAQGMAEVLQKAGQKNILGQPGASVARTLPKAGWGNGGSGIAPGTIVAPAKRDAE